MKASITVPVILIAIAFTQACKKDSKIKISLNVPEPVYENYSALKTGNYWVYQRYQIELNGVTSSLNQYDSSYVSKDTLIRGQAYFKMHSSAYPWSGERISFLRDSLHYTINSSGKIIFSSEDFSTVFENFAIPGILPTDTFYTVSCKMNDKDLVVQVPAGKFKTYNMQSTYVTFPPLLNSYVNNPRYLNVRYAKNMGIVSETLPFFSGAPFMFERRLLRYRLN